MSRAEDQIIGKLDRSSAKEKRTARTLQIRELAKATINCAVMEQPEEDRADFMREAARHVRTLYGAGEGEAEAVALFGSLAFSKTLAVRAVVSKAEAERLAHRLFPNPANENRGGEG